mmetsp:Transcript_10099/g.28961  ORF Transcript_10099/g.28961 Transcript_10099/m.28961 type:complete len:412 (-) Transcript_10099:39-1274(-)
MKPIHWLAGLFLTLFMMTALYVLITISEELEIPNFSTTQIDTQTARSQYLLWNHTDSEDVADYQAISDDMCTLGHFLNHQRVTRTIIFRCTDRCGGLGDRLRGIITIFYAALLLGCRFRIEMESPFPMSDFFEPTCEAFRLSHAEHSYAPLLDNFCNDDIRSENVDLNNYFFGRGDSVVAVKSNAEYWQNVIRNRHVKETLLVKRLRALNFVETGHLALNMLFGRPTFSILTDVVRPLVSLHLRTGDYSIGRQNLSSSVLRRIEEQVQVAKAWLKENRVHNFSLFVSSDNEEAVRVTHEAMHAPYRVAPFRGDILHVDIHQDRPREGYSRTIQDWAALGMSDLLVMGTTGFPFTATMWRLWPRAVLQTDVGGSRLLYARPSPAARARIFIAHYFELGALKNAPWWRWLPPP